MCLTSAAACSGPLVPSAWFCLRLEYYFELLFTQRSHMGRTLGELRGGWLCAVPDGTQLQKAPSPGRESPALGPLKSSSVMSAVLGGVRRGMETISSEAANVIQRVTNTGRPEGELEDPSLAGHVRYSQTPALATTSAGASPQRGAAAFWGSDEASAEPMAASATTACMHNSSLRCQQVKCFRYLLPSVWLGKGNEGRGHDGTLCVAGTPVLSRDFIEGWVRANGSAAQNSVKVLVATTDRLTKPRLSQRPAVHSPTAAPSTSEGGSTPAPSTTDATAQATNSKDNSADDDPTTAPSPPLTVQTGAGAGSEEDGDVESPVSLWISPSPTGPHSPLSADQSSAFGSSRPELQDADEDAQAVAAVMEELLARVGEQAAEEPSCVMQSSGSGEEDFQFDKLPNASVPAVPSVWPLGPPDGPPPQCALYTPVSVALMPCP